MSSWIAKTAIQKIFSVLPYSHWWNEQMQRHITRSMKLEAYGEFQDKLEACQRYSNYYLTSTDQPKERPKERLVGQPADRSIEGAKIVELGTGWFAIIPIGLFLQGASEIWSWDIVRHLHRDTFKRTLDLFFHFDENYLLRKILPGVKQARLRQLHEIAAMTDEKTPHELLEQLGVHALIGDARQSGLDPGSIDFVFSHQVLEHLSPQHLRSMFTEFRRLLKSDGVMCHNIGLADQFASFDSSITPFNFLKYSSRQWKLFDNSIIPQNRLRVADYRELLEKTGFRIVAEDNILGDPEDLRSVKLAPEFTKFTFGELLVLYSWMVATPVPAKRPEPLGALHSG